MASTAWGSTPTQSDELKTSDQTGLSERNEWVQYTTGHLQRRRSCCMSSALRTPPPHTMTCKRGWQGGPRGYYFAEDIIDVHRKWRNWLRLLRQTRYDAHLCDCKLGLLQVQGDAASGQSEKRGQNIQSLLQDMVVILPGIGSVNAGDFEARQLRV